MLLKGIKKDITILENCLVVYFHLKLKIHLPYDLEIPLLNIYPREINRCQHNDFYAITARKWKKFK